ncbi:unnamed protein product [Eruca vesicaria subsp. sativa]|uniref:Histone-lysine N-methyltransferase n=1 Tax=Eruca vesicaria subsp. sativa TaxID=29727 RepID=A0ABC8LJP2_ERUVS|nr:unnamed protein product [Eruca vesicaria subsp. sativa]
MLKEREEVEKLRNMTEQERREWERKNPKPSLTQPKKKWNFMQKYYHKGAFFQADPDDEAGSVGTDGIFQRDFSEPTGEDRLDKSILPKVMQVKHFGRSGRTKWTHLVNEDTTDWSNPKFDEAIDYLTKAIMLNPTSAILYATRGRRRHRTFVVLVFFLDSLAMPASKKVCDRNPIAQVFDKLLNDIGRAEEVSDKNPIGQVFNKLSKDIGRAEEFSLPDWSNQGKSTPYTYIKRIVCGSDCDCGMLFSSCSSSCNCGSDCYNKPFQQRRVKKLKLTLTEKCGSGIVADEYIQEGEFITEYVGEVIDDVTCEERLWEMKRRGETNFYLCEISKNMVIDGTNKGNKSRYINHSCNPNTQIQKWIIEGETRIGIFAISDINKGEHITYDYQFVQFGPDQECHCGAIGCRKKLGVKPKKPELVSDEETPNFVISELAQTLPQVHHNEDIHEEGTLIRNKLSEEQTCPRNCIGVVIRLSRPTSIRCFGLIRRFDEVTRKHSVMFEDGVTEFIDLSKEEDWDILSD